MKAAPTTTERKQRKMIRKFERIGLNPANLALSKPQSIRVNTMYVKHFVL